MTIITEDLIHLEIQHIKDQIYLLDAMWVEFNNDKLRQGYCESLKISIKYYLNYGKENFLHKLGYSGGKEE